MVRMEFDELSRNTFDKLRGRLAGLIESWGLPERQERAMIQTMKSLSYDAQTILVAKWEADKARANECDDSENGS